MKVILAGGTGIIGQALVGSLAEDGNEITVLSGMANQEELGWGSWTEWMSW